MTTTPEDPNAPLDDADITTSGSDPAAGGGDADGTDGGDADGTDGGDADGTRRHRRRRHRRWRRRRHRRRRRGRHRRRRLGRHRRVRALNEIRPGSGAGTPALDLLSGDAQTFTAKVWASLVHLHEIDPADLVGLLSLDDADALLTGSAIRTPAVRIARDGNVLGESSYIRPGATIAGRPLTGLVDARKALELFAGGATVVFQGLHRFHPPLVDLVAHLELELGHPCQANAYLTPPGSQGFAVHADTHDVFVFQTHGTKQWEVHHPRGERACEQPDDAGHGPDCRVDDVLLRPGLSMYLPTGTPHAARAQDDGLPARHHRHQPAHLARPGRAHRRRPARRGRRPTTCRPAGSAVPRTWRRGSSTGCRPSPSRWPPSIPHAPSTARRSGS